MAKTFGIRPCELARGSATDLMFDLSVIERGMEAAERANKNEIEIPGGRRLKRFF